MNQILSGAGLVVIIWAVMNIRMATQEAKMERERGDQLLQKCIYVEGENRVLTDQAKYYKALADQFLNKPIQAVVPDEQLARAVSMVITSMGTKPN